MKIGIYQSEKSARILYRPAGNDVNPWQGCFAPGRGWKITEIDENDMRYLARFHNVKQDRNLDFGDGDRLIFVCPAALEQII